MRQKKGEYFLVDFIAIIIFIILIIIFSIIFVLEQDKTESNTIEAFSASDAPYFLNAALQQQIEYQGQSLKIVDLVAYAGDAGPTDKQMLFSLVKDKLTLAGNIKYGDCFTLTVDGAVIHQGNRAWACPSEYAFSEPIVPIVTPSGKVIDVSLSACQYYILKREDPDELQNTCGRHVT